MTAIGWRRLDQPGHDVARLRQDEDGWALEGTAVFLDAGVPCRLDYDVRCDAAWRTLSAQVRGWRGDVAVDVHLAADAARHWTVNGRPCPEVQGCEDVDLSFTPATNLLPIRRLALPVGAGAAVPAAWFRFPDRTLERLDQHYRRIDAGHYAYESGGGAFRRTLTVSPDGWVTDYPDLWRREDPG